MKCPNCGTKLKPVPRSRNLNSFQWASVKAGDWFCETCPDNGRGKTGLCYWLDEELEEHNRRECEVLMHL
jgi:hypothetical protein